MKHYVEQMLLSPSLVQVRRALLNSPLYYCKHATKPKIGVCEVRFELPAWLSTRVDGSRGSGDNE